jgi:hypothetical protein
MWVTKLVESVLMVVLPEETFHMLDLSTPAVPSKKLRACLSAPWKGAELQWERIPTRQLAFQPVAAEAGMEVMKCSKPLVTKARKAGQRASRP